MRRRYTFLLLIALLMYGCQPSDTVNSFLELSVEQVTKISIADSIGTFDEVLLIEHSEIDKIVSYLKTLQIGDKSQRGMFGHAYFVNLYHVDNTIIEVAIFSDSLRQYVQVDKNSIRGLEQQESIYFASVIGDILIQRCRNENPDAMARGIVLHVESSQSRGTVSFELMKEDGFEIAVRNGRNAIIDTTGFGWRVLLAGDYVEVLLKENNDFTVADFVFITENVEHKGHDLLSQTQ